MEVLIRYKDDFIRFLDDSFDVILVMRRSESLVGFLNVVGAIDGFYIVIKVFYVNYEDYFNRK